MAKKIRRRPVSRHVKNEPASSGGVVISDRFWTWMWRFGQGFAVLGGVIWFAFQLYNDVGGLKLDAAAVKADVKALFSSQEKITESQKDIAAALSRVELAVHKK